MDSFWTRTSNSVSQFFHQVSSMPSAEAGHL